MCDRDRIMKKRLKIINVSYHYAMLLARGEHACIQSRMQKLIYHNYSNIEYALNNKKYNIVFKKLIIFY